MKKITAISLSALSLLALASCTCPACGGSGLQVRTSSGWVACPGGPQAGSSHVTRACTPCEGTGIQAFGAMSRGVRETTETAERVQGMTR